MFGLLNQLSCKGLFHFIRISNILLFLSLFLLNKWIGKVDQAILIWRWGKLIKIVTVKPPLIWHCIGNFSNFLHVQVPIIRVIILLLNTWASAPPPELKIRINVLVALVLVGHISYITTVNILIPPLALLVDVLDDSLLFIYSSLRVLYQFKDVFAVRGMLVLL